MALRSGHGHRLRLGIAGSNTLALVYEANPSFALAATTPTAIIFVCILSAIIIPLVRQEHNITRLMAPPVTESLQEQRIEELAKEFSPFRPRDGDCHAHCTRLHDGQRGKKARHLPPTR